jgi:aminoglycoside phosphotransferase (APT) family kinase protein
VVQPGSENRISIGRKERGDTMEERIKGFLETCLPGCGDLGVEGLSKGSYGASMETFYFTARWRQDGEDRAREMVLRRSPETGILDSDRKREYRVIKALEGSDVPVPLTFGFCDDTSVLERPFFIMEKKNGNVTPSFSKFGAGNEEFREAMTVEVIRAMAAIHRVDWRGQGLDFLGVPGPGTDYAASQVNHWAATLKAAQLVPEPVLTLALDWLQEHLPDRDRTCLLHGDFKIDNILYGRDQQGRDRVEAVLDWEMANIGDPMEELGWFCMKYYAVEGLLNGLVEKEAFFAGYEAASEIPVDRTAVHFWQVLSNVKMAAISLTGVRRFCEGGTSSNVMPILGLLLPRLYDDLVELMNF